MKLIFYCILTGAAYAFPGMRDLQAKILQRQSANEELVGDLTILADSDLTSTGRLVKGILTGSDNPQELTAVYSAVPDKDSPECKADTCCIWKHIADDMASKMKGTAGRCNGLARQAVRMGFHDAATWSKGTGEGGGSDGSLILARECWDRDINKGIESGCQQLQELHEKYKSHGVSMADMIQMAANVATVTCPLGPRVRSFVGRKDSSNQAPDGLLPSPFDSADRLIELFSNKTISARELAALVGAHTTSQQFFVDPNRAGDPQDSTPGVWDVEFYGQTTDPNAPKRVFKFQSDVNLSKDERTKGAWTAFSGPTGQAPWNSAYARAYIRLSLLGVSNINNLTECTKALPLPVTSFTSPDKEKLDEFANGGLASAVESVSQGNIVG
ncbi:Manganese peroxidase [Purpureocillium takamizusanense]|uniref:Peroxidase n=1 Tax=Purpureocillium takamizusanense TaxID=2060973 RepID=A0A9Q8VE05_9HYPO|nr:Manganese peroxidase [Purpureocillium takamizusanense]UNI21317.1 Manganese peroxidase [Purpureocillium takamizusanense]